MTAPIVTDHAVVRFLQRACGFTCNTIEAAWRQGVEVDEVRQMLADLVQRGVENGAEGVIWKKWRLILRGPVVVTVLTREQFYSMHASVMLRGRVARRIYQPRLAS